MAHYPPAQCLPPPSACESWNPGDGEQLLHSAPRPADTREPAIL